MSIVRRVPAAPVKVAPAVKADLMGRVAQDAVAVLVARVVRADLAAANSAQTRTNRIQRLGRRVSKWYLLSPPLSSPCCSERIARRAEGRRGRTAGLLTKVRAERDGARHLCRFSVRSLQGFPCHWSRSWDSEPCDKVRSPAFRRSRARIPRATGECSNALDFSDVPPAEAGTPCPDFVKSVFSRTAPQSKL